MKVLLLDRYPLITEMITMIIQRAQPLTKVITIHSYNRLLTLMEKSIEINLIVIDPKSPGCFGFSSVYHIAKCLPDTQIVILTDAEFEYANFAQLNDIPHHFINKSNDIKSILELFNKILNSNLPNSNQTTEKSIIKISKRQNQILNLLNKGYSNRQISIELGLAESTVKVHFFRLFKTIKVNNRLDALRYAKSNGLIFE